MLWVKLYVVGALLSWVLNWGADVGYFVGEYGMNDINEHRGFAFIFGVISAPFWPLIDVLVFFTTGCYKHGFKW